ncbi:MAG: ornithine cyclodeaminase family protein [Bacteroidetes bacterium]|nr:ornithine cyclodeaminase family protein [Bacteroidota bacterium]
MTNNLPFISDEQVKKLLPMNEAIELMKNAFIQITNKSVTIPQRINLDMPEVNADSLIMPVYSVDEKKYGVKVVSLNRDNPSINLPFIHALMILFDAENGKPLAILDAENLTAIRTGAASGLATQLLSNANSTVAAIFGAGIQARYQLRAICEVRNLKTVLLFDKSLSKVELFKDEMEREINISIEICRDENVLKNAQIICTATTSSVPVFDDKFISDGTHINAIGSYQPGNREIPSATITRSIIFADSKDACLKEAGDLIIPKNEGMEFEVSEIGEVLQNKKSGRSSEEELTLFKSVGNAAQDLICAIHIFEKYKF